MPFRYRLQKILEIRIRKKEEQMQVVVRAQQEVNRIELLIMKNLEQIEASSRQMRESDPMMYDSFDKFIKHLWEEDKKLQIQKQEAIDNLNHEKEILELREREVNVLDKHRENLKEEYIKEQKALELKELNEVGSQKHFIKQKERKEQEETEYLEQKNGNKHI